MTATNYLYSEIELTDWKEKIERIAARRKSHMWSPTITLKPKPSECAATETHAHRTTCEGAGNTVAHYPELKNLPIRWVMFLIPIFHCLPRVR